MNARTMYRVNKKEFTCWTLTRVNAEIARRVYPELRGGRIRNVLQMSPSRISLGSLYRHDDVVKPVTAEIESWLQSRSE